MIETKLHLIGLMHLNRACMSLLESLFYRVQLVTLRPARNVFRSSLAGFEWLDDEKNKLITTQTD